MQTTVLFLALLSMLYAPLPIPAPSSTAKILQVPVYASVPGAGSGPTAGMMLLAYWDAHGYPNLLPGSGATLTGGIRNAIASPQFIRDYALPQDTWGLHLPDQSITGKAHKDNCLADFMHTARYSDDLAWEVTGDVSMVALGVQAYARTRGVTIAAEPGWWDTFSQNSWDQIKASLDAGRPALAVVGHNMPQGTYVVVVGYREPRQVAVVTPGWPGVGWWTWPDMHLYGMEFFSPQ